MWPNPDTADTARIADVHTIAPVASANALRKGVDLDRKIDRLLWLEAQGLQIARAARRLRQRAPQTALVDEEDLSREIARLSVVTRVRTDEVRIWRSLSRPSRRGRVVEAAPEPARPVPMPAPLRRWWWPW